MMTMQSKNQPLLELRAVRSDSPRSFPRRKKRISPQYCGEILLNQIKIEKFKFSY
ncbi:MAG: hypothetical protein HY813_00340 [Candidatus Portnoybacteria bacterium]|nr:hypothetical protein [Candidatus Portnoybacteria bacterium]